MNQMPIKLIPEPVERVWGGEGAKRVFNWTPPNNIKVGEWWILSFRHDHPSWIGDGEFQGHPLPQLIYAYPELLGPSVNPNLLIKILDSADALSIQVHPDDALAQKMELDSGKTECWLYLESNPKAFIYCGIKSEVSPDEFFKAAKNNPSPEKIESLLNKKYVKRGDLSFIPAGEVHAVGKDVLLLEVQQNSDTTFRIYDWGRPREVHINEAKLAVMESKPNSARVDPSVQNGVLVSCDKFRMTRFGFDREGRIKAPGSTYASVTCLEGQGKIQCKNYLSNFEKGDTWFLPARCPEIVIKGTGNSVWILSNQT